jgi:hypothetical protein
VLVKTQILQTKGHLSVALLGTGIKMEGGLHLALLDTDEREEAQDTDEREEAQDTDEREQV